ncbi:MAG: glucosamine-6-phosphate deaminase, partial [Candidatus Latescibacterota bacterium]
MGTSDSGALTPVERRVMAGSPWGEEPAAGERIRTLVVDNFPALGRLAALRFLEWVQDHPGGVVSLPTGRTPEHFIHWVTRLVNGWDQPEVRAELEAGGLDPSRRPDLNSLRFVQIDEFYPIDPSQHNSFHAYVSHYYLQGFGLDPDRALLIDCREIGPLPDQALTELWPGGEVDLSLRFRAPRDGEGRVRQEALARVDQWCQEYEDRIRRMGGIGFFLGGIGPDGHVGFNVRGSDHHSTTRLTEVNYETQAAAATDLGGIEVARRRLVITIGLGTITANPDCCAVIVAAGEAKAGTVAAAVQQEPHVQYPATALHALPNARFYVTAGAARLLRGRQLALVERSGRLDEEEIERIVVDLAVRRVRQVADLTEDDFRADEFGAALRRREIGDLRVLTTRVRDRLIDKLERGVRTLTKTRFLHTEPHHDDLMLGYLPHIVRHVRDASNVHYFACLTGGFTAVTNRFIEGHLARARALLATPKCVVMLAEGYFAPEDEIGRNRDVWQYLDGVAANDLAQRDEGAARRFLRNLIAVFGDRSAEALGWRLDTLAAYFAGRYPGQKDIVEVQQLKSLCREWEAECLWGYFGWNCANVRHLRLGFYTGDVFTEEPTPARDVAPVTELLREVRPDLVSVALDPEASGPDTHYKVLQAVTAALREYQQETGRSDLRVWGYRNVWFRFHPSEANLYVPVSLNMFSIMHSAFMNTF